MKAIISENGIVSTLERHHMWFEEIKKKHVLYFGCHTGLGKTSQAEFFASEYYKYWTALDAEEKDIYERFQSWLEQVPEKNAPKMLIIDNITYLTDENENVAGIQKIIQQKTEKGQYDLIIISRTECPAWIMPYRLSGLLQCYGREFFLLSDSEIKKMVQYELADTAENLSEESGAWLERKAEEIIGFAKGYGLGAYYYTKLIKENGNRNISYSQRTLQMVWEYLEGIIDLYFDEGSWECFEKVAVFPSFTIGMAADILSEEELSVLHTVIRFSSCITLGDNNIYQMNKFFKDFTENRFMRRNKSQYLKTLELAGKSCEKRKLYREALQLYHKCGNRKLLAGLMVTVMEKSDGTRFPRECHKYLSDFTEEDYREQPSLLYCRIMIESYRLRLDESDRLLEMLRKMAVDEQKENIYGEARKNYFKALLCLPHQHQADCQEMTERYMEVLINDNDYEGKLQVTGGGPSIINGGTDQTGWPFWNRDVCDYMKNIMAYLIGPDGEGLADVGVGEYYLEVNDRLKAVNYVITGISALRLKENFRGYYAANAVMARTFLEENRMEIAKDILRNLLKQVKESEYPELEDNIRATYVELLLYEGAEKEVLSWLEREWTEGIGNPINQDFYASERYRLYVLAKAYAASEKYLGASVLIQQLLMYADMCDRKYLKIKLFLLSSVIMEANKEDGTGKLEEAVWMAAEYGYVRVIADGGAAIRKIWKKIDWEERKRNRKEALPDHFDTYLKTVEKEMKKMAGYYPDYMSRRVNGIALSKSENPVMHLIYQGKTNEEIAGELDITLSTVKFHVSNILKKMQAKSRQEAVKKAVELGWYRD